MIIVPPKTEMEWAVYNELTTNEYWKQSTINLNNATGKIEVLNLYSEGEKAVIYDTFKQIDKMIKIDYSTINLHQYLIAIDKTVNHTSTQWITAIKKIVKGVFNANLDDILSNEE